MFSSPHTLSRGRMLALCLALLGGLVLSGWWSAQQRTGAALRSDTLRLHVRADSDSVLDQTCKLAVRDALLELTSRLYAGAGSAQEARAIAARHLPDFQLAALKLRDAVLGRTHAAELRLERLASELKRMAGGRLAQERLLSEQLPGRLRDAVRERLAHEGMYLASAEEVVAAHAPERLLKLGFALLRCGGRGVVSAGGVRPGDELGIELADGTITATVTDTKIWQKRQ